MKVAQQIIASNGVPYFQMRSVGPHTRSGSNRERTGQEGFFSFLSERVRGGKKDHRKSVVGWERGHVKHITEIHRY